MKPILGLDVDGTVWDTGARAREVVLEVTGDALDLQVVSTWAELLDRVLSPERVRERQPYPGSAEVLRYLQAERGIGIHFITRNHDPAAMTPRLEPWLEEHFGPEVGLTVTTGDNLGILRDLSAFGLIDDRPEILERAADAGL